MLHQLRLVYFTPADTRDAGFLETDHFGVRFPHRASHVDLTAVPQRWLRDLLWDYLAGLLRSPACPRTGMPVDAARRGITELGVFLEAGAPGGGHDPAALDAGHMQRFITDQRQREREGLPSLAMKGAGGTPSTVTAHRSDAGRAPRAGPAVHHLDARRRRGAAAGPPPLPRRSRPRAGR